MRKFVVPALIVSLLTMITVYVYTHGAGGVFHMAEQAFRDALRTKSIEQRQPDDRIKMIAIDEPSLAQLGSFPWPRSYYAKLSAKLMQAGARAVVIDLLMLDPSIHEEEDERLSEQLSTYPSIYLPVQVSLLPLQENAHSLEAAGVERPPSSIRVADSQLGHVNVIPDGDGVIRKISLGIPDEHGKMIPSIDVLAANQLLPEYKQIQWDELSGRWYRGEKVIPTENREQVAFDYFSSIYGDSTDNLYGYDRQSFVDVWNGTVDPSYYKNSVVLIGPYAASLSDRHMTPLSRSMTLYGVEIHANMVQSLVEGRFYKEAPFVWNVIALLLGISVVGWSASRIRGVQGAAAAIGIVFVFTIVWIGIYESGSVFIPYFTELCGMGASFVLIVAYRGREERRARQHVEDLFGRYVSPAVVTKLLESQAPVKAGGVRTDISVMFIDVRGFTPLSERLTPEITIQILNQYLHLCADTIFKHNGTLDKFMGDGVMAIFGAPQHLDNHAEHAVRAALELQRCAEQLRTQLEQEIELSDRFGIGIGIQSGEAIVGNVGSDKLRLDYTAIGDTVNVASRLESRALPGQIVVGEETYLRVYNRFQVTSIGALQLKGKSEEVLAYEVRAEREGN